MPAMNALKLWLVCLSIVGVGFSLGTTSFAQIKPEPRIAVEKEISVEKDLSELTTLNPANRTRKFRLFDFETLEIISSREEPSRIYELLPQSTKQRTRIAAVNLYRNDLSSEMPFRIDMRISTKLSFETRSRYVDSLIILDPFKQRVRIGLGHQFSTGTSLTAFFDPLQQEVLGILAQRLNSFAEINLLGYHSEKSNKSDAIVSLKFLF